MKRVITVFLTGSLIAILTPLVHAQIGFTPQTVSDEFDNPYGTYAADIDSDGDMDILGAALTADDITWWENDGAQNWTEHTIDGNFDGAISVYAIDVDSDGDMDVVGAAFDGHDIAWFENDGEQNWTTHLINGNFSRAYCVFAIDLDGDDDIDVLGAASTANDITWWENDGDENFTQHTIEGNFTGAYYVHAADVDGDGDIDVLGAARTLDDIVWWENDGEEVFTQHIIDGNFDGARSVLAVDINGDGDMDVLGTARDGDEVTWWENDGGENFTEHTISDDFDDAFHAYATDMDLDGDVDIIAVAIVTNAIYWWENDGEEVFTEHVLVEDINGPISVYAVDIDGDIDVDVVAAVARDDQITWWENDLDPVLNSSCDGTITDAETEDPVEDAIVSIGPRRDTTDVNGHYSIDNILDGELTVRIVHDDYTQYRAEIDIQEGENTFNFELTPLSPVSGRITDVDTEDPVEDAEILFGAEETTTDENGEWEIPPQGQGEYDVLITAEHYYNYAETVEVEQGENTFDFELIPLATVTGTITDSETDLAIEGAEISFDDFLYTAVSDENGDYSIEDVEAGEYTLLITAEGYFDYEEDVEIDERENVLDFAVDILSGDLTGIVSDELTQELLFGAAVTVIDPETNEIYREVQTDEDGEYTAESLHDGIRYLVFVEMEGYAPADTEEVLIRWNQDNEQDFELTPIFERGIAQLQTEQDLETWVTTTGIVTQGTNVTDTENTDIYIQDDSGWGIQVWSDDAWDPENNINRGDEIDITGFLVEVDEITRIINFDLDVIGNDNPMPEPLVESTGDMATATQREGTWGQISGQINRDPPNEGDYSLIVDDGSGQCEARIIETTGIDLSEFSINDWGIFTGVIGLSRQGLRIIPNIQEDVERIAIDPPTDLTSEHEVIQSDTLRLEVTLSWEHDHLDDWLRFKIYRDEEHVGNTQELTWSETHVNPNPGEYGSYSWIYTVTAIYDEGESEHSNDAEVIWDVTNVLDRPYSGIPTKWALEAVYPNPFNPELTVLVALPEQSELDVRIYNILGEQVALLADENLQPGYKQLTFDASELSSGIYFIHAIVPGKFDEVRKVVLMR
ncbi:MAG: carboxypeptidase regulatory-like domain-containing protein [Candidatus Electryonea clarkiae]|nr:carboxypeptidase regulatory-like domain-containing protein [Candidatus Electryonea clarkiae]MDP8285485.1 carboxypeptidase regulatory-like domain-containing protein [Candidatus Electryonea clarkiae]